MSCAAFGCADSEDCRPTSRFDPLAQILTEREEGDGNELEMLFCEW